SLEDLRRERVGTADVVEATHRIASTVLDLFGCVRASVFRLDPVERVLVCVASAGAGRDAVLGRRLPPGSGAAGRALVLRRVFWSSDVLADPNMALPEWNKQLLASGEGRAAIGGPLMSGRGALRVVGLRVGAGRRFR